MTSIPTQDILCSQGLVRPHQADRLGQLRADAAATIVADAVDAFLATRRDAPAGAQTAQTGAGGPVVALTLGQAGTTGLRSGDLVSCWIGPAAGAAASKRLAARLSGVAGPAWEASIELASDLPAAADGKALPPPEQALPPMRVMRTMRQLDCDQAGHVNVQVFMELVDEAVGVLCRQASADAARLQVVRARISFKQELFEGDVVTVHSGIQRVDPDGADVVHGIVHQPSGRLACVVETRIAALDASGRPAPLQEPLLLAPGEPAGDWPALPLARPPALPRAPSSPDRQAVSTSLSVVDAWDADRAGWLTMRSLIDLCSTGARQYLATLGLNGARFQRESITVAAVDYLIDVQQRPRLGSNLTVRSAYLSGSAKSLRFSHHVLDSDDGTAYATVEIVGVMLNLATHRSMEVPADVRQRLGLVAG